MLKGGAPAASQKAPTMKTIANNRDFPTVKELCQQLQNLSVGQRKETALRGLKDLNELKKMSEKIKIDDELSIIEMESIVGILNSALRKSIIRMRSIAHIDEKELTSTLQQHRDEFSQFISKRRLNSKKELRQLFQSGSGIIGRLGDLISDASLEGLQLFEKTNDVRLCKDAIRWFLCNSDDTPSYFSRKICLLEPKVSKSGIQVSPSRLEFTTIDGALKDGWACVYSNRGPWAQLLMGKQLICNMIHQTWDQLRLLAINNLETGYSYVGTMARLIDLAHPTHQLQASALAYPLHAETILKRRLVALGYDISPATEDNGPLDGKFSINILKQMYLKLETEHRYYFEFTFPDRTVFRAGVVLSSFMKENDHNRYPGMDEYSFGFGSDGYIYLNGNKYPYLSAKELSSNDGGYVGPVKTWGILIDLFAGSLSLVRDGKIYSVAFGKGAKNFPPIEQERQKQLLTSFMIFPSFALLRLDKLSEYIEKSRLSVNFGRTPFFYQVNACSCDHACRMDPPKGLDSSLIEALQSDSKDKANQEEEERLQLSAEKNFFRNNVAVETLRSFSQFPPSIYRRSLACTRIQRAWRRFRGRRERAKLREMQYAAATLIQRVARKKLRQVRTRKNEAAFLIQKNWRKLAFIKVALMRCIYQQPIPELHRSAATIQKKWRHWYMFRNSPIATKYNARIEDIIDAVNTIIAWWRPLYVKITENKKSSEKHKAATDIQRVFRGYYLRQLLRQDLREKLKRIGQSVVRHRAQLFRVRAAYVIQKAWRSYIQKRVRTEKIRTRNRAAARIQSFWKGYWVRSHIHLRFTYGEAVFLTAVCKALRNSHFILKMYRPCGIVCPKPNADR